MEFIQNHIELIYLLGGTVIGILLPKAKTHLIGKKIGEKIPKKLALAIADHLNAFEKGLRDENYRGDKNLISNDQLSQKKEKLMLDLGLEQRLKVKDLK